MSKRLVMAGLVITSLLAGCAHDDPRIYPPRCPQPSGPSPPPYPLPPPPAPRL